MYSTLNRGSNKSFKYFGNTDFAKHIPFQGFVEAMLFTKSEDDEKQKKIRNVI